MADDVNSNNKPVNGKTIDTRVEEILRAESGRAAKNIAIAEQSRQSKLSNIQVQRHILEESGEDLQGSSEYSRILNAPTAADNAYNARVAEIEQSKRSTQSKQISTLGRRSRIDRDITHMAQGHEAYMAGTTRESLMMSSTQRESQIGSLKEKIESGMSGLSTMTVNGASERDILAASGQISGYRKQASSLERGGKEAVLKGLSEDRLIKRAEKFEDEHKESRSYEKIREEARSGGKGDIGKVTEDYNKSVEDMAAANVKLKNLLQDEIEAKESSVLSEKQRAEELERIGGLVSSAKDKLSTATKDFEKAGVVKKEVENAPSMWDSNFGANSKFGKKMRAADQALTIAMDAGAGYKEFTHSSEMRKGSAKANVINATNDLYFKSKQAIMQGDVGAALDVMDSVTAARYADDQAKQTMIPNFVSGAGRVIKSGLAGAAQAGIAAAAIMGPGTLTPAGMAVLGGSVLVGGVAGAVANSGGLIDSTNGTAGINDRLEAYNTMKSLSAADRAIKTDQMQAYYSHGNRLYGAVQGLGGGGGTAYNAVTGQGGLQAQLMDPGVLKDLASTGVSADMAAGLLSNFQSAGSFKGKDAIDVMKMSGTAGQKGNLSRDQYTGMAAQLMGAGGGAGDLQKTLEFAVAKGMDSSKSIAEMVQASLSMSSDLADMGVSASGATSTALMATVAGLDTMGVDKNLAVRAAQASMYTVNQQMQDRGMSIGNIVETDAIRKAGGTALNAYGAERIGKMGNSEWAMVNAIRTAGSPTEKKAAADAFKQFTNRYGLTSSFFKGKTDDLDEQKVGEYEKGSLGFLLNKSDQNEKGQHVGQAVMQKIIDAQSGPNKRTLTLDDFSDKEKQSLGDELPNLIGRTQKMGAEEFAAFKEKYNAQPDLMGAGGEKTKAETQAEIIKLGKEFADKLTSSNATAFAKIDELMDMLKKEYVVPGAERSKQSGDTGKIVADLTDGASQFKAIVEATAKRARDLDLDVEIIPSQRVQELADSEKKTWTRR